MVLGRRYVNVDASSSTPEPRGGSAAIMVPRAPLWERGRLELPPGASRRLWPLRCCGRRYVNVDASSSRPGSRGGSGHRGTSDAVLCTWTFELVAIMVLRTPLCEH